MELSVSSTINRIQSRATMTNQRPFFDLHRVELLHLMARMSSTH